MIHTETHTVDGQPVHHHTTHANGEPLTLIRPTRGQPEVLIGGALGYTLNTARQLHAALGELIAHADNTSPHHHDERTPGGLGPASA